MRVPLFVLTVFGVIIYFASEIRAIRTRALEYDDVRRIISAVRRGIGTSGELATLVGAVAPSSDGGRRLRDALMKSRSRSDWRESICNSGLNIDGDDMRRISLYFSDFGRGVDGSELRGAEELEAYFNKKEKEVAASSERAVKSSLIILAALLLGLVILMA